MIRSCLVLFLLLISLVECTNYKKCVYYNRVQRLLRCYGNKLGAVPANLPADLIQLKIKNDDLSGGFEFPEMTRLRKLHLTNVNIGDELPKLAFAKLKNLQELVIQYLPRRPENYSLSIHPEAFHMLKKLSSVRLYNLGIRELPENMFKDSRHLKTIYILGMQIDTIRSNTFAPLENVIQLNLGQNQITTVEEGTFDCVDAAGKYPKIYLPQNNLRTIPTEIDSRIEIRIHDNPIVCDCKLAIPRTFKDRRAKCEEPSQLSQTYILDLKGKRIQCVCHLPTIVNGVADHDSPLQPGDQLKIRCDTGYSLKAWPNVVCLEDGTFGSEALPECIEDLIEPVQLEDGSLLLVSNAFSVYPNPITLSCPPDSVLKSCKCSEYNCRGVVLEETSCKVYAAPDTVTKGELVCLPDDLVVGNYIHHSAEDVVHVAACRPPYQITACTNYNPMDRVASDHGVINPDDSEICEVDCGDVDCELHISCVIFVEKEKCDKFSIYMGTVTKEGVEMTASTTFEEGDAVTLTCDEGYEFDLYEVEERYLSDDHTQAVLTCIQGETYDPPIYPIPNCYEVIPKCELDQIDHVIASPGWTVLEDSTITLTCEEGYEGVEEVVQCEYNGVFQQPQISCQERQLSECYIRPIPHTELKLEDGSLLQDFVVIEGTVIVMTCEEGYQTPNNQTRLTCLRSGKLSEEIPTCTPIPEEIGCVVPLISHGGVDEYLPGDEIEPGTVITFKCKEGYELRDLSSETLECISNQYYRPNKLPRCKKQEVRCKVPIIVNGYYYSVNIKEPGQEILKGEALFAVCNTRYELTGPKSITCIDENFGGAVNTCEKEKIDCGIPQIKNGKVLNDGKPFKEGEKYPIVCDRGYYNTYTYINCVAGPNTFDPYSVPDCLRPEYGCPKVGFPLMKPLIEEPERGDTVEVECIEGYELVGQNSLVCGERYDYTVRKLPECVPIAGCETPTIEHGSTNSTLSYLEDGVQIQITCNSGYRVYGDSIITCMKGSWSGLIMPECRLEDEMEADCNMPYTNYGHFWPLSDNAIVNPGSTLVLHCDDGYGVESDYDRVRCITNAKFEPPLLPECSELEITGCTAPVIEHGRVAPNFGIEVGDTVVVSCEEEFMILGSGMLVCRADGGYDELPTCSRKPTECPVPVIENAIVTPEEIQYEGDSYLVMCNDGFERVGDEELICGEDGETYGITNHAHPICRKIPEPCQIPRIRNGWITFQNEREIAYGEEAFVICDQPNYGPDQTRVTCIGNNRWDPPLPRCTWEGPTCEFPIVANGVVTPKMDVVMPWTVLNITCNEGFEKNPKVNVECIHSGDEASYDNKIPVCEQVRVKCNRPIIENGYINGPYPLETDDRFTVECNEGYQLLGPAGPLVCYKDDIYSRHLPVCQKKNLNTTACFEPFVQNGNIVPAGAPFSGYYVTVVCHEGHFIVGSSKLQCLSSGKFDHPIPQCVIKHNPKPDQDLDPINVKECGQRSKTYIDPKIYGGRNAEPGEYPWNVLIEFTRGRFCGGSIVGKEWVLTAGHCLLDNIYKVCNNRIEPGCTLMDPDNVISITAGVNNKDDVSENWQVRTAVEVSAHPFFASQHTYIDYDVGLIKVNRPFVYNESVNRICLPKEGMGHLVGNLDLHVTGWGKTNTSQSSDVLQKISVPYVSRERCNAEISYDGVITETMFCAGYQMGMIDACQGDSGGPLVYLGTNGTFVQGGIISWGRQCAMENFYGVYTNLAYFYTWIMSYIGEN